jgi:hypothetical protein
LKYWRNKLKLNELHDKKPFIPPLEQQYKMMGGKESGMSFEEFCAMVKMVQNIKKPEQLDIK